MQKIFFTINGITRNLVDELAEESLEKKGDSREIIGISGRHWGFILKSLEEKEDPLVTSSGNKITNQTALKIVKKM